MKSIKWDKLRILVTNRCNYCCPFCHNEGQEKDNQAGMMSLELFNQFIDYLDGQKLSEINFSGGEPFLHKGIAEMISYANAHLTCDISCATNLSLITDEQIRRLAKTRVKFNIQFPFATEKDFASSTGTGNLLDTLARIEAIRAHGMEVGLNTVIQSLNMEAIERVISFALKNEIPLKLLPQIGLNGSDRFIEHIQPILEKLSTNFIDKGTGALKWTIQSGVQKTSVLYIDSPCFKQDIETCRNYGEIRVLPNFTLQTCILKSGDEKLALDKGREFVIGQFEKLWNNFNHC